MAGRNTSYRVCRSNRKIVTVDYSPECGNGAARLEVYQTRFWDMGTSSDYEFQKIADVYPNSLEQLENVVHCFGVVWTPTESFEEAMDMLTEDYRQAQFDRVGDVRAYRIGM